MRETSLLKYWIETKQRQALGYWPEALYQLCTFSPAPEYRRYLAEAILIAEDAELGLPPSLLGGNLEAVQREQQIPCPSPADPRLRVANLSHGGKREILVVNGSSAAIALDWERTIPSLTWKAADGQAVSANLHLAPRAWLVGCEE